MKLLALLPAVVAGFTLRTEDANIDSMKEVFVGIAKRAKETGQKIDDTTKGVVREMINSINSTLVEALIADKISAQSLRDIAFDAVEGCNTARGAVFSGAITNAQSTATTADGVFHDCKNEGISDIGFLQDIPGNVVSADHDYSYNFSRQWNDEADHHALGNTSHEHHSQSDMATKCGALDALVRSFDVLGQDNSEWCEAHDASDFADQFRTDIDMRGKSYTWFHHMDNFEQNNAADYKEKRRQCHEARHRQQVRVQECHRLQHDYESKFCSWAIAIDEECHTYSTCYTSTYGSLESTDSTVEDMEVQFKKQQHALENLLCYGEEILKDITDLSACDNLACDKCADLDLAYPDPHAEIACAEAVAERPCDAGWSIAHYNQYAASEIPIDACNACASPTYEDWTVPKL